MRLRRALVATSLAAVVLCQPTVAIARASRPYQPVWHLVYQTPNSDAGTGLFGLTAPGKGDAWAVGIIGRKRQAGYIVHWNGRRWLSVTLPAAGFRPWAVDSSAPDDVWVFGQSSTGQDQAFYRSAAGWQAVPRPPLTPLDQYVNGGLVVNAGDVWLMSYPVVHWNGQHWQIVHMPRDFSVSGFADVDGTIWAVGEHSPFVNGQGEVAVYQLRHGQWQRMAMPHPRGFATSVVADGPRSVFVTATRSLSVATSVLYWNGRHWRNLPAPPAEVYFQPLAAFGADGLWLDTNMLWNGSQWISIWADADGQTMLVTDYGGIAQIPHTRSSWLAMQSCTGPKQGCRGQIWVAGRLPH